MYKLSSHITIGILTFDFVCDVSIKESINTLTDTCIIKLPKKMLWNDNNIFYGPKALITEKDAVEVKLGYNGELKTVFKGYVRNIARKVPVELECEDEMFRLKWKENVINKKQFAKVSLKELLDYILPSGIKYIIPDEMSLGKFTIEKDVCPVNVLEYLKKDPYNLQCYFQLINNEPVLFVGLPQAHFSQYAKKHKFQFQHNIINDNIQFVSQEMSKIKVKCTSFMPDNTKIVKEAGEPDGALRSFNFSNVSLLELTKIANDKLNELQKDGYSGTFTVFGEPVVHKADTVNLSGDQYINDNFTYSVSEVNRNYGMNGYRQVITIDRRLG